MNKRIGFIGCGNMGKSMLGSLVKSKDINNEDIMVSTKSNTSAQNIIKEFNVKATTINSEVTKNSDIIFLAVKPFFFKEVIEEIKDEAIKNYKEYKILPSITIAQAILESSWGESDLAQIYNNLFGIKADSSWKGEYVTLETFEFYDTKIEDKFRVYSNKNQSIKDHAKFLVDNQRYKKYGVFEAKTYIEQAYALQNAGYSTAEDNSGQKRYAKDLIELIRQYNLQLIDSEIKISD